MDREATYYEDGRVLIQDHQRGDQWVVLGTPEDVAGLVDQLERQGLFDLPQDQFGTPCSSCITYWLAGRRDNQVKTIRIDTPPWITASQLPRELGPLRHTIAQLQIAVDSTIAGNPPGEVHIPTPTPTPPSFAFGSSQTVGDLEVAVAAPLTITELEGTPKLTPTRGQFLIVPLRVVNRSDGYQQLAAQTTFVEGIRDRWGHRYPVDIEASNRYSEQSGLPSLAFHKLAPWETVQGILVFDVPSGARGFRLTVRDADPPVSNPPAIVISIPEP
ncbi:MAG: DUF4352 domain-containing protein [Anaerolineae bacterium]|nr:DUF4352 domain-containing protein [Anaerolineae bacterium]